MHRPLPFHYAVGYANLCTRNYEKCRSRRLIHDLPCTPDPGVRMPFIIPEVMQPCTTCAHKRVQVMHDLCTACFQVWGAP